MTAPATPPTFTQRPWVTAGVALTAAGMVAAAPVAVPDVPQFNFTDIQLTATGDLLTDTAGNLTNLIDYFAGATPANFLFDRVPVGAPFPIMQQVIANQIGYLGQILQDPSDIGTVFETMFGNVQNAVGAPFGMFADNLATGGPLEIVGLPIFDWTVLGHQLVDININTVVEDLIAGLIGTDDLSRLSLFGAVDGLLGTGNTDLGGFLSTLLNFTGSPASGVMLGAMGPVLGPMIALANDVGTVFDGGDPATLLGIPEHMLYALLNGGETLSLVDLLGAIGIETSFDQPLGAEFPLVGFLDLGTLHGGLDEAGIELGGLLGGPGSLFNALTAEGGLFYTGTSPIEAILEPLIGEAPHGGGIEFIGDGAGPFGSLLSVQNAIADAISNGTLLGDLDGGLLSTFANGLNIDFLADGLDSVHSFLTANLLDPVAGVLTGFGDELSNAISGLLGSDLGIDALTAMLVNIPQLLLTMML